jgi:hypothetical protein
MAIGVKINFENTYEIDSISSDLRIAEFETLLVNKEEKILRVEISNESHELLDKVFNLSFGPLNSKGEIDDKAELVHQDYSKVFSTILLTALNYLSSNPGHYLGIDGSDNSRAYYYWRFLQRNFEYLNSYFEMSGLKYYVRISRFGKTQYENPFDFEDIFAFSDRLYKTDIWPKLMYNYFVFKLRKKRH